MIILFGLLLLILLMFGLGRDSRNKHKYADALSDLPPFKLVASRTNKIQNFINMSTKATKLDYFEVKDGFATIAMQDGSVIHEPLHLLEVTFEGDARAKLSHAVVKYGKQKVKICKYHFLLSNKEWELLFRTLLFAGKTHGARLYLCWTLNHEKELRKINKLLKKIK